MRIMPNQGFPYENNTENGKSIKALVEGLIYY